MRRLLFILFALPTLMMAQRTDPSAVRSNDAGKKQDPPGTIPQGTIKVRRPAVLPYFKCEYYLTLASVREVEIEVPSPSGFGVEKDKVPVFDSSVYPRSFERMHPKKMVNFSKYFVEQTKFAYPFGDTSSIDTMVVEMWIAKNGKIRWKSIDTAQGSGMPRQLELELYMAVNQMTDWGEGGGYKTPKKFMRKQKRLSESYYCVMYVIASVKPLTAQQKSTGSRYTPLDFPLNEPAVEGTEKDENKEKIPVNDSLIDKDPRR